ncbi:BQ2448_3567 [Microbotryum intermedium]|uniref:BQ2448_3567 protein n=1 Tax=Microbotryum intermedium TaxID=269621 RepID=A0A238FC74_9BASI|nr:BQ2448_3567 [Microbotryum intermedium]
MPSPKPAKPAVFNKGNEREPLLASQRQQRSSSTTTTATATARLTDGDRTTGDRDPALTASNDDDDDDGDDAAEPVLTPEQKRKSLYKWLGFWAVVGVVVVVCVVQAFKQGGGQFDWRRALAKAGGGGLSGALAMIAQVLTLMPLRTTMNYQYRYGGSTISSVSALRSSGGYKRFYAGLGPALVQGPIARFGDTAANAGILALLESNPWLSKLPSPLQTAFASVAGALFRMILVPIDTLKTTMQTEGSSQAFVILKQRVKMYGLSTLWAGAFATAAASFIGSFPWFATYNFLSKNLPPAHSTLTNLSRQAFIGFSASVVSDTISNSLRVVKTYRQVNHNSIGYRKAARKIWSAEGWKGLFGRGLKTRILANGLQGLMFSVLWKLIQDTIERKKT